jgi:hypothetical protein
MSCEQAVYFKIHQVGSYPEGTPVSATNNLLLLSTPRTTNDSHHAPINLDDPMLLSASLSDSLLFPASASFNLDSLLSKQNLGDPRIDEILSNQRKIVSSLNSLHGLVKHIIQQQPHTGGFSVSEDVIHVVDLPVMHINNPITETVASTIAPTVAQPSTIAQPSPAGTVTDQPFSNEELSLVKLKSSGPTAFATTLFRKLFSYDDMKGRNCRGLAKKGKLDEKKMEIIQEQLYKYYPNTPENLQSTWARCIQTMDSYIRNKQRKLEQGQK